MKDNPEKNWITRYEVEVLAVSIPPHYKGWTAHTSYARKSRAVAEAVALRMKHGGEWRVVARKYRKK